MKRVLVIAVLIAAVAGTANAATINLFANMDGPSANAGAGTGSPGIGTAVIQLDDVTNLLSWNITWSGLIGTPTLMHFHGPALPNQNAGVQVGTGVAGPPVIGNAVIDNLLLSQRRKTGSIYVEKSKALRACIKAMKRGDSVGLLVDQRVERGIEVTFFGRPTIVTDLPARLALKFNCPIIPAEAVRAGPRRCQVMVHEPIWPGENRGEQAVRDLTQQMASVVEDCIRKRPDEWCCDKRRWKKSDRAQSSAGSLDARCRILVREKNGENRLAGQICCLNARQNPPTIGK